MVFGEARVIGEDSSPCCSPGHLAGPGYAPGYPWGTLGIRAKSVFERCACMVLSLTPRFVHLCIVIVNGTSNATDMSYSKVLPPPSLSPSYVPCLLAPQDSVRILSALVCAGAIGMLAKRTSASAGTWTRSAGATGLLSMQRQRQEEPLLAQGQGLGAALGQGQVWVQGQGHGLWLGLGQGQGVVGVRLTLSMRSPQGICINWGTTLSSPQQTACRYDIFFFALRAGSVCSMILDPLQSV